MSQFPDATYYPISFWGYPYAGNPRRLKPTVLLVVHITGNSALPNALAEAAYSNRPGSGASFTFVTNRDGSIVQCLDPLTQTPWTNGDINAPNTSIPTVKAMVGSIYNPNEFCFATCENVGYEPGNPISAAQKNTLAQLVAWLSKLSGLPINRSTVLGHRDINSVSRHGCPTAGDLEALLAGIIAQAQQINTGSNTIPPTEVLPVWTTTIKPTPILHGFIKAGSKVLLAPYGATDFTVAKDSAVTFVGLIENHYAYVLGTGGVRFVAGADIGVTPPAPTTDCTAQVKAATDPINAAVADLTSKLSNAQSRIAGMKSKVSALAADIAND